MRVRRATATVLAAFALAAVGLGAGTAVAHDRDDDHSPNIFSGTQWTSEEGNYGTANAGHDD
ncbi:hypothetical protein [Streptomyces sp. MJP52]|uniref:hypothetical protein n=1 Tax=Streptomyces sp. MJP52 TaxID=2940555 RepID=UPI0024761F1E|nr:hypothetical protein [Streptomyces sp. MJP52]MDH6226830.1 hypothetical protein [Streptomyces sp. MJP52]